MSEKSNEGKNVEGQLERKPLIPKWAFVVGGLVVAAIIAVVVIFAVGGGGPGEKELTFTVYPETARRGEEVRLYLSEPTANVMVYFNNIPLPKKVLEGGAVLEVTIPGSAAIGYAVWELVYDSYRVQATGEFIVVE